MVEQFLFYSEAHIAVWAGLTASNLYSLWTGLQKVSGSAIFYHMHHSLLRRHFTTSDYMNDFARWVWTYLNQPALAEKLASVDPWEFTSVRDVREKLLAYLEPYVGEMETFMRVPERDEFQFIELRSLAFPTGLTAIDLPSFRDCLRQVGHGSLFYHLIEARLRLGRRSNDFSEWLSDCLKEDALAERINNLSPYAYNLWQLRSKIIELVEARLS
ncbi:MAG: hypothetical protein D6723_01690 [Acidobacteria bacterium]|nr:MAG: hypothetical protein D6723_01690 [Acidobacteriota bacterium]